LDSGSQEAGLVQDRHSYNENKHTSVKVSLKIKKRIWNKGVFVSGCWVFLSCSQTAGYFSVSSPVKDWNVNTVYRMVSICGHFWSMHWLLVHV